MIRAPLHKQWARLVYGSRWIGNQSANLFEVYTGVCLCWGGLDMFSIAVSGPRILVYWYRWLLTFVWVITPAYRFPVQPISVGLFWEMWMFPLSMVILPWLGIYMIKKGITHITVLQRYPEQHTAHLIQRHRMLLSYLYVIAQFENAQQAFWKHQKSTAEGTTPFSPSTQTTISKYAGPISFFYVSLANYLSLQPFIQEPIAIEGSLATTALVPATEQQVIPIPSSLSLETNVQVQLYLFDRVRVRIVGTDERERVIEKPRQAELLAYVAMHTREQAIRAEMIVTYVYDNEESEDKDAKQLLYLLHNDVAELRNFFKQLFQEAGLPYSDPFTVEGRGKKALWRLSKSYIIADISSLETAAQQVAAAKLNPPADRQALRKVYELALQCFQGRFLKQHLRAGYARKWAKPYIRDYQNMYRQLLWDTAEYEQMLGDNASVAEQHDCLRRSANLYREYAFVTMPGIASERALQHSITISGQIGDIQGADRTYCKYMEEMQQKFPRQEINSRTTKAWEDVVGA